MPFDQQAVSRCYLDVFGVAKSFKGTQVMSGMDFRVARGELVSLRGPSGCGKSTLLHIIAGLLEADDGSVVLDGHTITQFPAHKRNISVVFQNYALFPNLTVAENVAFGLRARGMTAGAAEALSLLRMSDFADRSTGALSGGQQQRVSVARALVVEPDLLLLDEPFLALDRKLRETMQVELKALLRDRGITAIFVTHDQEEAMGVSDRIAVMNAGRIEQFADPATLYARPVTPFVMDLVGLSTRMTGLVSEAREGIVTIDTAYGPVKGTSDLPVGAKALIAVRPELVALGDGDNSLSVTLADVIVLGSKTILHGQAHSGDRILCELPGIRAGLARGETVSFGWPAEATLIYEAPA